MSLILLAFASLLFASAERVREEALPVFAVREDAARVEDLCADVRFEEVLLAVPVFLDVFDLELAFAAKVLSL